MKNNEIELTIQQLCVNCSDEISSEDTTISEHRFERFKDRDNTSVIFRNSVVTVEITKGLCPACKY